MKDKNLERLMSEGLKQLGLKDSYADKLMAFVYLLDKWNKTYNLTAIRDLKQMIILHVMDSASVYRHLQGKTMIDVGTGGGIPGIIIAILNPQISVTLLDSNQKKTRFLRFVLREMNLDNITVVCERVEKYQPKTRYDVVISRAFSEVGEYLSITAHLCADDGRVYAMKGPRVESEKDTREKGYVLVKDIDIDVPFLDAKRRLLIFDKI